MYVYGMLVVYIVKQLTSFQSFVYSSDFSVIAVTETWLHDYIFDNEILSSGYNIQKGSKLQRRRCHVSCL